MGRRMSSALRSRAAAIGLALAIAFLALAAFMPTAKAESTGVGPAAMIVTVVLARWSHMGADRGDYNPRDTINALYCITSHVITNPSYAYEVDDENAVVVLSGTTNLTFFAFRTSNPASRSYTFHVTASDRGNTTQAQATIIQATGFVLGLSFDRSSYAAGDTIHARLTLTARGPASLPSQFRWSLSIAWTSVSAITTGPVADLSLRIPQGTGGGGLLVFAHEFNPGASAFQTVPVGGSG